METLFPFLVGKPVLAFMFTAFWSGICFVLGAYIGHRFSLGRDRRKEFNAAADVVRGKLRIQKSIIGGGGTPSFKSNVTSSEYNALLDVTTNRRKRSLHDAWQKYQQSQEGADDFMGGVFHEVSPQISLGAVEGLMPFADRK